MTDRKPPEKSDKAAKPPPGIHDRGTGAVKGGEFAKPGQMRRDEDKGPKDG